jgi:hypothetical protein
MAILLRLDSIINAWQSTALPCNEYDSPMNAMVMSHFKVLDWTWKSACRFPLDGGTQAPDG